MKRIAFIRTLAFVVSIIIRIIRAPFYWIGRGIKYSCRWIKEKKSKKSKKREKSRRRKEEKKENKLRRKVKEFLEGRNGIFWRGCLGTLMILEKIFWLVYKFFNTIFWLIFRVINKIYWLLHKCYRGIYWWFFYKKQKIAEIISKNDYVDLFFVFFQGYLKHENTEIELVKISSVKEFVAKHSQKESYQVVEEGRMRTVCIPEFFEKNQCRLEQYMSPEIYVAQISDAAVIGASNVIIADHVFLNDSVCNDKEKRVDIRYSVIKKEIDGIAVIEKIDDMEEIECGISLVGAASFNYYHLLVEILSRLPFVDSQECYRKYPILVDEIVLRIPQFTEALNRINRYGHPIIRIEKEKKYLVHKLVLPSSNVWMPTNLKDRNSIQVSDFLISENVLKNLRDAVGVWDKREPWRKIFISRKNTKAVRLKNEEAVREIFKENGFEIIYTEEMTFEEQIECFGQAKCVVATSGAALTNTIFCQRGTVIGCIIPSYHRFYMYSTIAYLLGLRPIFLDAEIIELSHYSATDLFVLDCDYVKRYINYLNNII